MRGCVSCPVGAEACVVDLERDRCRCAGGAAGSHGHRNVKCLKARRQTKDHIHDDNRRKQRELDPRDYRPFIRTVYCGGFQQVFGNILKSGNINDHIIARALPDRSQADRIHGQLHAAQPTDLIRFGDPKCLHGRAVDVSIEKYPDESDNDQAHQIGKEENRPKQLLEVRI
mgnify:FL=1